MKKLTAAQTKSITNAKDQVKAAANVMIETPLELIKCILLKHETAVIGVMKELHEEKMRLQQQRDELTGLLRESVATLRMWKDVAPAVSLCAAIDAVIAKVKP